MVAYYNDCVQITTLNCSVCNVGTYQKQNYRISNSAYINVYLPTLNESFFTKFSIIFIYLKIYIVYFLTSRIIIMDVSETFELTTIIYLLVGTSFV